MLNTKLLTNKGVITFSQLSSSELSLQSDIPLHICDGCIH